MRPSFLGSGLLRWCDSCHAPVLDKTCGCGAPTRAVQVTPPGDVRPAFPDDISLVNRIYEDHFGAPLVPPGHLALLNKVPDSDRMEEIIVGGGVAGAIRFLPGPDVWEPIPRPQAAVFMRPSRRYVVADQGAIPSIRNDGASLLAPGLIEIEPSVQKGDEVFILDEDGACIAVGRSKVDAADAGGMKRGVIVRTRRNFPSACTCGTATWKGAVRANASVLEECEREAADFVRNVCAKNSLPVNVSYSGGKDSLVTLILVKKVLGSVPILFADTGLEFPETCRNVEDVSRHYAMPLVRVSGEEEFWKTFEREGPPAVDFRWCCRTAKLRPVGKAVKEHWGECLSFIGQRKYESYRRMMSRRVWRNPHVRGQLSAAPIHHWTALHVWLYLFREDAPYNPLYEAGLDRVGCFMCPSSDVAVLRRIRSTHPGLWEGWNDKLEEWQRTKGLPESWRTDEGWRVRGAGAVEEDSNC